MHDEENHQATREAMLSNLDWEVFQQIALELCSNHKDVWKNVLINASDEFADYVTQLWDSHSDTTSLKSFFEAMFAPFPDSVNISKNLMAKKETYVHKCCSEILKTVFQL